MSSTINPPGRLDSDISNYSFNVQSLSGPAAAGGGSSCAAFPNEIESYYCLSCHTRCSGLALLVGAHVNHDYLPLSEAVLYIPAALLREARDTMKEMNELLVKPRRAEQQHLTDTVQFLSESRRNTVEALRHHMAELQSTDAQLLRAAEAMAVATANWHHHESMLRKKVKRLQLGAVALSSSLPTPMSPATSSQPSWAHSAKAAQRELAEAAVLLHSQEAALRDGTQRHWAAWQEVLRNVPWMAEVWASTATQRGDAGDGGNATVVGAGHSSAVPPSPSPKAHESMAPADESPHPFVTGEQNSKPVEAVDGIRAASTTESTSPGPLQPQHHRLHPSDAEVLLLQHALCQIDESLRRRLLRAAAASLSTSREASGDVNEEVTIQHIAVTPLRERHDVVTFPEGRNDSATVVTPSKPPETSSGRPLPLDISTAVDSNDFHHRHHRHSFPLPPPIGGTSEDEQRRWNSLLKREQLLKDSLEQLLRSNTSSTTASMSRSSVSVPPSIPHGLLFDDSVEQLASTLRRY